MLEYKQLHSRAYNLFKKFLTYTFERYLPFPTIYKVKVVLNHCKKTNQFHIEVYIRNEANLSLLPILGHCESAEKYVAALSKTALSSKLKWDTSIKGMHMN